MQKIKGLTFIELLISLILMGMIFLSGLFVWGKSSHKNHMKARAKEISMAIRFARNLALVKNLSLVLAPLPNEDNWSKGMILFVDNKTHRYTDKDKLIYQWQWSSASVQVIWHGFYSDHYLLFAAQLKHAATSGHFLIESPLNDPIKLVVNRIGRVNFDLS